MNRPKFGIWHFYLVIFLLATNTGLSQTAEEYAKSGNIKYSGNDYNGAISDYTKWIELEPLNSEAYLNRGKAKVNLQDFESAISDFNEAIEINPSSGEALLGRGYAKINLQDYRGAIDDYKRAIEINPTSSAYFLRGMAQSQLGYYEEAIADFTNQIQIDPGNEYAFINRGNAYIELEEYKNAINDFSRAIRINPNNGDSYLSRGKANIEIKDFIGALKDFTKAIELSPDDLLAHFYRGNVKSSLRDFKGAVADYNEAIKLYPEFYGAYLHRGKAKSSQRDFQGAIIDFTYSMRDTSVNGITPEYTEATYLRGMANIQSGGKEIGCNDLNEAAMLGKIEAFEDIYKNCSPTTEQLEYLLIESVKNNNLARAKELLQKGVNVNCVCNYRTPYNNSNYYFTIESCSPINVACDSGFIEMAKFLLEKGADANNKNGAGMTPLMGNNNPDFVRLLIEKGADVKVIDISRLTPLHMTRDYNIASLLINKGADVNAKNEEGLTPLHLADTIDIARLLIEKGADVNAKNNIGETPLCNALINNKMDIVRLLLSKGASLDSIRIFGDPPLIYAIKDGNQDLARLLIEKGANVNENAELGNTPLHLSDNVELSGLLIAKGAAPDAKNDVGETPLFYALNDSIAKLLIDNGADVNSKDKMGETPLHKVKSAAIARTLARKGAHIDAENEFGETPLYFASTREIAALLIDMGANVNAIKETRTAPLFGAVKRNSIDVAGLLIEKGANINIRDNLGDTPLHLAGSDSVALLLIEKGAVVDAKDNDEESPLYAAIENNNIPVARLLIEKGADVNLRDRYGNTPVFFALSVEAVSILLEKGAQLNVRNQDGDSPLHKAVNAEIAKFMIRKGALLEAKNNDGKTPLMLAIQWRNEVANALIEAGADINAKDREGSTLVFNFGYIGAQELIYLIEKGADIKIKNNFGITPLHLSYLVEIDSILVANGADVNAKDIAGRTPLHYASEPDIVRFLISKGANVNVLDTDGYTAFTSMLIADPGFESASELLKAGHPIDFKNELDQTSLIILSIESGENESIKYLLDNGADNSLRDKNGKTALDYSKALGKVKFINLLSTPACIRILNSKGQQAVIELIKQDTSGIGKRDTFGNTLLHYMVSDRCDTLINYITSRYKNSKLLNTLNSKHQTPLLYSIELFNPESAIRLIEAGADVNIPGAEGESPLYMAEYRNLDNVITVLKKKGAVVKSPAFPVELSLPMGHVGNINCISISPDEKTIISGDNNNIIKIWDIITGKEIRTFSGHAGEILCLAFSPDGRTFVSGSADKTIRLWDIQSGKELHIYSGHQYDVNILKFLPGGKSFVSNDVANNIIKWDIASGAELPGGIKGEISLGRGDNLCFSPDGQSFIRQNDDNLQLFDISTEKIIQTFARHDYSDIKAISFSDDGKLLITSSDSIINLWDVNSGKELRSFIGNLRWIESPSFSPDGKSFIVCRGRNIVQWDIASGKVIRNFNFLGKWISKLKFLHDGKSFISDNYDGTLELHDINSGNVLKSFKGISQYIYNIDLSNDGKGILVGSYPGSKLVNITTTIDLRNFNGPRYGVSNIKYSPDNRSFISAGADSIMSLWNIEKGKIERSFRDNHFQVAGICFSPDGKTFLSAGLGWSSACILWDIESGKELKDFGSWVYSIRFTPDGKSILAGGSDTIWLFDVATGKKLQNYPGHFDKINSFDFSPDGKSFISGSTDETINHWDITGGTKPKTIFGHDGEITSLCFSRDGKTFLSASTDKTLKLWDASTGQPVRTFAGHAGTVVNARFHPSGKFIISSSDDKTIKYWNIDSTRQIASLVLIDSLDWVLFSPDKYYATTKNGAKALAWVKGTRVWNFDQWDLQYNRPDIVFGRMPDPDTAMIKLYYKAYQKRLKKMKFSESMFKSDFNTPEVQIENQARHDQEMLELDVAAVDTIYTLDRINVWVNDVPAYGVNGLSLRNEEQKPGAKVKKQLFLKLSQGDNKIEVSVLNSAGAESLKQVLYAKNEAPSVKKDRYFIAISCAEYKDDQFNLKYSVKDGRDMARQFAGSVGNFDNIFIDTLFDRNVTRENVAALKNKLLNSKVDDEVILFASGHGLLDDSLDFYFATYDIDFQHPEKRGISFDVLENILDSIPARRKLLMMDACHSGEVDKEDVGNMIASNTVSTNDIAFRGIVKEYNSRGAGSTTQTGISLNNSLELMQEMFAGLDKGTGTTVISAAAGKGYALESPQWNNGVFTYSIINGLKNKASDKNGDGIITISELKNYSIKQVQLLTGGRQKPTARRESINYDWAIRD